jgi:hypothetical protein
VIVAVVTVRVVQVAIDQVVGVIAVGNTLVAAFRAVLVRLVVSATVVLGRTAGRIGISDCQFVLFDLGTLDMVQMPIMKVINVTFVDDARVPAVGPVLMGVAFVVRSHGSFSFLGLHAWSSFQFDSMRQGVLNQIGHMPIGQCVIQVVAFATANNQPFRAENAEALGDGRELVLDGRHDLGHAQFALLQQIENA